jgi:hypothetical protein
MASKFTKKFAFTAFSVAMMTCSMAQATPLTFAGAQYANNFRDISDGGTINSGLDVGGTGHTALNFTGNGNATNYSGAVTLYDTSPADAASKNLYTGNISIYADILISEFNNSKGPGILFLYNEGSNLQGLAMSVFDGGGSGDRAQLRLTNQAGEGNDAQAVASVNITNLIANDTWYRLTVDLAFSGANYTVTGKVFNHTTGTNPDSALGAQIGQSLTYTASVNTLTYAPYQIGLVARGTAGAKIDSSVTNFEVIGDQLVEASAVPEPGSVALFGIAALGIASLRRRKAQ